MNKKLLTLICALAVHAQMTQANIFHIIGDVANIYNDFSCHDLVREINRTLDEIASYDMADFIDKFPRETRSSDYALQDIRDDFREISRKWGYFIAHYRDLGNSPWYGHFENILSSLREIKIALRRFQPSGDEHDYRGNLRSIHNALRDVMDEMRPDWWFGNYGFHCLHRIRDRFNDVAYTIRRMR